jgi:hypothetical protein
LRSSSKSRGATPLLTFVVTLTFLFGSTATLADETPEQIQGRFDTALQALNAERVYTARRLLKALLVDYPTLHRARLELARAEYLARDFDAAEAEIQQVLEDPEVPPSVRTTLLAFLAQIRDDKQAFAQRHGWSGQIYAGVMYDSNVNFGPERDLVDIGGLVFQVNPLAQERSDGAGVIDTGLLHTFNPNRTFKSGESTGFFLWQTQGNGYYRGYQDETDFNLGVLTLRTGPAWVVPEEWRASIGLQGDQIWFGGDDLAFFTTINPSYSRQLDEVTDITVSASFTDRDYKQDIDQVRDGKQYRAGVTLSRVYSEGKLGMQTGVAYTDFDASDERFSFKGPEVFLGAAYEAWERGSIYSRIGYRRFKFGAPEPLFPAARDDDEWRLITGFRHELVSVLPGWVVRGEWVWTDNSSNNPLFDFDRHQLSLGLQKSF